MQIATSVRLFQIPLLFAIIFTDFFNNAVFAENSGGKGSKSSENIKQTISAEQRIYRRSTPIPLKIPDNFPLGIMSSIRLDDFALLKAVKVGIHIAHPHVGDLLVQLECPNGLIVTLHNRDGDRKRNLDAAYRVTECDNSQAAGKWTLHLSDNAPSAAGSLLSWNLHLTTDKTHGPLFGIGGVKDWYLIGNSITSGDNIFNVRVFEQIYFTQAS